MRARDIHSAAEHLVGEPLKWSSVKGTLGDPACCSARRATSNTDHVSVEGRPLALDAHEAGFQVEDEVVPLALTNGPQNADPTTDRLMGYCGLRNGPLLIRRQDCIHVLIIENTSDDTVARSGNDIRR